jgi:hypothetical protein
MRPLRCAFAVGFVACAALALLAPGDAAGQQILQDGFEGRAPVWKPGSTDTTSRVLKHELDSEVFHDGKRSEHIQLQVEKGTYIYYTYDIPRAPITEEFNVSLYLKSNRPGIQLLCRVVLPNEKDPDNLSQPRTLLLRCEPYQYTRWKLITLREPQRRLREQQQLLALKLGRAVVTAGAYVDQLVLNVYDGPGLTDVWIDDLEVGPVLDHKPLVKPEAVTDHGPGPRASDVARRSGEVQLQGNQLVVSGKRFFMRGIRYTGTPLKTLRDAGFNTVWLDESTPPPIIDDAASLGFWIVPSIRPPAAVVNGPSGLPSRFATSASTNNGGDDFLVKLGRFHGDAVLAWDLGSNLGAETFSETTRFARTFRNADMQQPVLADVFDGYRGYSRSIDSLMLGTHRWPLMTTLQLNAYRQWLDMRRRLSMDNYSWTWIQTHLPEWFTQVAYDGAGKDGFSEPVGPQAEQIRLLAYLAVGAGYRGLAFWSDRYLADSHQGRDRLLAMALLNQELEMLEGILMQATQPPEWIDTANSEVKAAVFRIRAGVLVIPVWVGSNSQFVPGQSATPTLVLTVPGVPITATAWEVSPGRMQSLRTRRELGGLQVQLHNFSLTSAILFTSDLSMTGLVVHLQDQQRRMGRLAAQWLHDQAQEELAKVERVQNALTQAGHSVPDAGPLLDRARKSLERCVQHRRNGEHTQAYNEAEVALRALRVLMRADWDRAVRDLDSPVSSPYAVSFFTLPRHWELLDQMKHMKALASVLPDGGFETPANAVQPDWLVQPVPSLDNIDWRVRRVTDHPHTGNQCVMLRVAPKDPKSVPSVLERTCVLLHSPVVRLAPGTLVRISAWVRIPQQIAATMDGALLYDSIGGEPLAIRLKAATAWKKLSLYRRVPASGKVNVTLALAGIGEVFFDDVRIEPLMQVGATASAAEPPPVDAERGSQQRAAVSVPAGPGGR